MNTEPPTLIPHLIRASALSLAVAYLWHTLRLPGENVITGAMVAVMRLTAACVIGSAVREWGRR